MMKEPHPLLQLVLNDSGRLTMPVYYRDQQYCPTCLTKVLKSEDGSLAGTVAKLAMRQPFVLFKGLTFQKLCLP
ncbi:hypothetical protein ACNITL_25550, partial [Escherichia coli]